MTNPELIRILKFKFNQKFDELFTTKGELLDQIHQWRERLQVVLKELGRLEEFQREKDYVYQWSKDEKPELILPNFSESSFKDSKNAKSLRNAFKEQSSTNSWEFEKEKEIIPPTFINTKPEKNYSQAEYSIIKQYKVAAADLKNRKTIRTRELEVEEVELSKKIRRSLKKFNKRLKKLYISKLEFHKCILSEELKILNLNSQMDLYESLFLERSKVLTNYRLSLTKKDEVVEGLVNEKISLAGHKEKLESLKSIERSMEKGFKKEFSGHNFNQLELLTKAYKKRPKGVRQITSSIKAFGRKPTSQQPKAKTISSALETMSNLFRGSIIRRGENSVALNLSLDQLDHVSNCPDSLDLGSWNLLCSLRRKKIDIESDIAALETKILEKEMIVAAKEEDAKKEEDKIEAEASALEAWRKKRNLALFNNKSILIDFPLSQIKTEISLEDFIISESILISSDVMEKLEDELKTLQEDDFGSSKEFEVLDNSIKSLHWEKEKLDLQVQRLGMTRRQIRNTKLSKEERQKLQALQDPTSDNAHLRQTSTEERSKMEAIDKAKGKYYEIKMNDLQDAIKMVDDKRIERRNNEAELNDRYRKINDLYVSIKFSNNQQSGELQHFDNDPSTKSIYKKRITDLIERENKQLERMNRDVFIYKSLPTFN